MLQNNYDSFDYQKIKENYNLNMVNFANLQTDFIINLPKELNRISHLTDKISNLNIISGNCYLFKKGSDLKEIENKNIIFDKEFNSFKLKPTLSYSIESKENSSKLISNKNIRIYDKDKTKLKNLDDLLVRNETININTKENNYSYTFKIEFGNVVSFNNVTLFLNEETLSYPNISEIYYINNNKEKISLKILNNNSYNLDIDLFKNNSNKYLIDTETGTSDNINIVFEDSSSDLIIDKLDINYMEYNEEGYIILEGLKEAKPILKVGLESEGDINNAEYSISYNQEDWYHIDLSNIYGIEKTNKVLAFNTISSKSLKNDIDIKSIFIKIKLTAKKSSHKPENNINKQSYNNSIINVNNIDFDNFSLYENTNSIFYGKLSKVNIFNFEDLYNNGEYLLINNNYYIKGFVESSISKIKESPYTYSPVSIKSKEIRKSGEVLLFPEIDISTKELYSTKIKEVTKNLLESKDLTYVIPVKEDITKSVYYLSQNKNEIKVNLEIGYINSALDVLYIIDKNHPVYLLDSFKNPIKTLTPFIIKETLEETLYAVSLLQADIFITPENISMTYPITTLGDYELGFLDNQLTSINLDKEVTSHVLETKRLYSEDSLSTTNTNYSKITSKDDYKKTIKTKEELLKRDSKQIKLINNSLIKGSIKIREV